MPVDSNIARGRLKEASVAIHSLIEKVAELQLENDGLKRQDRIVKIAQEMERKGLSPELDYQEKVAHLGQQQDLDVIERAIEMAGPDGMKLASVAERDDEAGATQHAFLTYIATGDVP